MGMALSDYDYAEEPVEEDQRNRRNDDVPVTAQDERGEGVDISQYDDTENPPAIIQQEVEYVQDTTSTEGESPTALPHFRPEESLINVSQKVDMNIIEFDFQDHFSLKQPSAHVRLRKKNVGIYELANDQLQLEHELITAKEEEEDYAIDNDDKAKKIKLQVTMKRMRAGSLGLRILRTFYTLIALLVFGLLFVFTAQMVLYHVLEIPVHLSNGNSESFLIASILSLPVLVYSMASLMVFGMAFISDTWNGHVLFSFFLAGDGASNRRVAAEWFCFGMYVGIPVFASAICFYVGVENALNVSLLIWYICMNVTFFIFCGMGTYHEIKLCLDFTRIVFGDNGGLLGLVKTAILVTLTQRYAGSKSQTYSVGSDDFDPRTSKKAPGPAYTGLYTRSTLLYWNPFFTRLDVPERRYSMEEIREMVPYVTNKTWSLEKMCCRLRNGRSRLVVSGPGALESSQFKSTLGCTVVGIVLMVMFTVGALMNMGQSVTNMIVVSLILVICVGCPILFSALQLYISMPDEGIEDVDDGNMVDEAPFFQAWASYTVTKPKEWYCWFRLIVVVVVLFLWPMIAKYVYGTPKSATFFLVIGLISGARFYLDAGSIIREYGTLSNIHFGKEKHKNDLESKQKAIIARARASEMMGKITTSSRMWLWFIIYIGIAASMFYIFSTYTDGEGPKPKSGRPAIQVLDDFYYEPQPDISYPTCKLNKGYPIPGRNETHITDYNMLAALSYEITSVTDYVLDKWFQETDFFIDETPLVAQWKKDSGNANTIISFKLFSVPSQPGFGVVAIRGTEITRDKLINVQLYASSVLMQAVNLFIPFGWIFGPIYPDLLSITSWIGSEQLRNSNYYSIVTDFVNDLVKNNYTFEGKTFDTLRVTGVSLGGGLAMIVGAQTGAYAVGFAGPNPTLARKTFTPPVSLQDINERVLNVVPDTDFVSRIGGEVRNTQHITCRDYSAPYVGCHSFWKQLCEFMYSCGSEGRPILCLCNQTYGFPEPIPKGNRNFADACSAEYNNFWQNVQQ